MGPRAGGGSVGGAGLPCTAQASRVETGRASELSQAALAMLHTRKPRSREDRGSLITGQPSTPHARVWGRTRDLGRVKRGPEDKQANSRK